MDSQPVSQVESGSRPLDDTPVSTRAKGFPGQDPPGRVTLFWIAGGALLIPLLSLTLMWSTEDTSDKTSDPVVLMEQQDEGSVSYIARFAPQIRFSSDRKYSHTFRLWNHGTTDLLIKKKVKSCSCLRAEIDPEVIPPGQYANVLLEVQPLDLISRDGSITIETNDGKTTVFAMKTWTFPPVMLDVGRTHPISFGRIPPGVRTVSRHRLTVHAYSSSSPPQLRFLPDEQAPGLHCTLQDRGVEKFADGRLLRRNYDLQVAVDASMVPGLVVKKIRFAPVTEGKNSSRYEFSTQVNWMVGSPVQIKPPRWVVSRQMLGASGPIETSFTVQEIKPGTIRVHSVESLTPWLRVSPLETNSPPPSGEQALPRHYRVQVDREQLPQGRSLLGEVKIQTELLGGEAETIVEDRFRVVVPPRGEE